MTEKITAPNTTTSEPISEGLPDIAEQKKNKQMAVIAMGAFIVVMVIIRLGWSWEAPKKTTTSVEETYTVPNAISPASTHSTTSITPTSVASKTSTASQESSLNREQQMLMQTLIEQKQKELQARLDAPLMLVENSTASSTSGTTPATGNTEGNSNTQFMNQVSSTSPETINARLIGPLPYLITEGTMIDATLESASNTDLPGYLRASVSKPVYSEDDSQILIPVGSRLLGQYKSDMAHGQQRIFVVWTRLIIPGGISINLGSPGVDSLGVAGLKADAIDHHFLANFGSAILRSVIVAGASNIGVSHQDQYNASQAYRIAVANSIADSSSQSLSEGMIPPTLVKDQGAPIKVFVAHDLNFQTAMHEQSSLLNVF